nr:NrtA/SsuA/CpmA family ABC transporter substrate-binding protein [Spirochaetales bacterium]
ALITLGVSIAVLSIPVYFATEQGYFAVEGLDITIKEYDSGKLATKAMFDDEVNIATVADMPIVFNSFKRQDFCIFTTFTASYNFVRIVGRKDKGLKSVTDLKGKKIGMNRGTSSHFYLGSFLTDNELSTTDVETVDKNTQDLPDVLQRGEVDAISVWQPYREQTIKALGDNAILFPSREICRVTFSLAGKKNFVKEHQEVQKKLIRAFAKAAIFIRENRRESQDIISKEFNLENEIINTLWDDYIFGTFLDQALLIGLDDIARWAINNQFTDKKEIPNFLDFICSDALDTVKPEMNSIIK